MNITKKLILVLLAVSSTLANAETLRIERAFDEGKGDKNFPATNAIDGKIEWDSRWVASGTPSNLTLDLGEVKKVTDIGISWGHGDKRTFTFEIWARAQSRDKWVKVLDKGHSTGSTSAIEIYDILDIDARFIRVKTHSNSAGTALTDIQEVKVYKDLKSSDLEKGARSSKVTIPKIYDDASKQTRSAATNAIDGSTASAWSASSSGQAVNLVMQFNEPTKIDEVSIAWGEATSTSYKFEIYARGNTNGSWIQVYKGDSIAGNTKREFYDITDMSARQVRIKVRSNSKNSEWMTINEITLYGGNDNQTINRARSHDKKALEGWDWLLWDMRGENPTVGDSLVFKPLTTKFVTPKGNGWRHELKIKSNKRAVIKDVYEDFKANLRLNLSNGSKTIFAQYYAAGKGTIMKLYISDAKESGVEDGVANNGIFDVYVILAEDDILNAGKTKKPLGTVNTGDNFDFQIVNVNGYIAVNALGESVNSIVIDDAESYLVFGNYLQAQDPNTAKYVTKPEQYGQFYKNAGITNSELIFSHLSYTRRLDK